MIKNIIFDFGDIFINLDKQIVYTEIKKYGNPDALVALEALNKKYEVGAISSDDFVKGIQEHYPTAEKEEITSIWNAMLLDFPDYRLDFIEALSQDQNYRLFLLSNTNALHISRVEEIMGTEKYNRFKACFEQFYLSHEIHLRKPNTDIYEFVLSENNLKASETFFVDDTKENTDAASSIGISTWNLLVGQEDIIDIKTKLEHVRPSL